MTIQTRPIKQITAAGAVVLRDGQAGDPDVLLVHRPRYNDWSLPKGKINTDEYLAGCAVRETLEETAVAIKLGIPVDRIRYQVGGGTKTVSYWRARMTDAGEHVPNAEIDDIMWLPASEAVHKLTYDDERPLIDQGVGLPDSTPLLIVRHTKAMLRANWSGRDQSRPLDERGRRQSRLLIPLLEAFGVSRLASSTSTRCMKTLAPYAKAHRLEVDGWTTLSEEQAERNPKAVTTLMQRLIKQTIDSGAPLAVCGHRPVLPVMLNALGIPDRPMQPGAVIVAHLGRKGETLAVEHHRPRI